MTIGELENQLMEFNEDERFYQQYYNVKQDKWMLEDFLESLDFNEVIQRRLIVPEVSGGWMPSDMKDEAYFDAEDKNHIVISKHNRFTPPFRHRHIFFELAYVVKGHCSQDVGKDRIEMEEGDFCLLAPDTIHSVSVFDDSLLVNILVRRSTFEDIFFNMLRDTNMIATFFNQSLYSGVHNPYLIIPARGDQVLKEYVLSMFLEYLGKSRYYEKILNNQLMILFAKILQSYEDHIQLPSVMRRATEESIRILSYIEDNYQSVTLKQTAAQFHFSQPYCSKIIKEYTGKSFTQIVQEIRFQKAAILLKNTNISIAEISSRVGFENVEHFNRMFRKLYEMPPGKYRKGNTGSRLFTGPGGESRTGPQAL